MRYEDNNLTKDEALQILAQVGQQIRKVRKSKKILQSELAKKVGTQKASISRIENGTINITVYSLHKMALAMDVSEKDLLPHFQVNGTNPTAESRILSHAKFRRLSLRLQQIDADMAAALKNISSENSFKNRMTMHSDIRELIELRQKLLAQIELTRRAVHR